MKYAMKSMSQYCVIKLLFTVLLSTCFISACSSSKSDAEPPKWLDDASSVYSEQLYLSAVGHASKRDMASNNALANLAKIFTVDIKADSKDFTKAMTSTGSGIQTSSELSRSIVTSTDLELKGAVIKETWQSPQGDVYALALLEKQRAANHLSQTIRSADKNTKQLIAYSSNTAPNIVLALSALRNARSEQLKREIAQKQLVQVANKGIPASTSSAEIETLIKYSLAQLKVATDAESERSNSALQSALGQLGIPYADSSNLLLKAELDTIDPVFKEQWYWLRGSYALSIMDGSTVISSKRWTVKISAREEQLLQPRLQDEISVKLPNYLVELLSTQPTQAH